MTNYYELEEYNKCKESISYFFYNYIYINNALPAIIPYQYAFLPILENLENIGNIKINFPRLTGASTVALVKILHSAIFNSNKSLYYLCSHYLSENYRREIINFIDKLPSFLKIEYKNDYNSIIFLNKSLINFTSYLSSFIGTRCDLTIIDIEVVNLDFITHNNNILYIDSGNIYGKNNLPIKQYNFIDLI